MLHAGPTGIRPFVSFYTNDAVFDCCWSEERENILITAGGDGSIIMWDVNHPMPIFHFEQHQQECVSVDWNAHVRCAYT